MGPSVDCPAEIRHVENFALNMWLSSDNARQLARAYDAPPSGLMSGEVNATLGDTEHLE